MTQLLQLYLNKSTDEVSHTWNWKGPGLKPIGPGQSLGSLYKSLSPKAQYGPDQLDLLKLDFPFDHLTDVRAAFADGEAALAAGDGRGGRQEVGRVLGGGRPAAERNYAR